MNDQSRHLADRFLAAYDRFEEHMRTMDPASISDHALLLPLNFDVKYSQWAAIQDILIRHGLTRSAIDAVR